LRILLLYAIAIFAIMEIEQTILNEWHFIIWKNGIIKYKVSSPHKNMSV